MSLNEFWKNGIDFEKIDKRYIILSFLLVFLLFFPFIKDKIVFIFNTYEQNKEWKQQEYEQEYFGRIIRKGKDKSNHKHDFPFGKDGRFFHKFIP